ncbi:hypothetical protein, partial [Pseudotabrizicola sp.]|uniref:hypothetical protein n=1 Tax=Pseudotabrizicola sp. TaxID=2939647 RepID=UPI002724C5FA
KSAALSLTLALGACVQPAPQGAGQGAAAPSVAPLRVTNNGQPFRQYDGAAARRVADATCAAQGRRLRPGVYDRFEAGTWVYVGGCV